MPTPRADLRSELNRQLLPELRRLGFVGPTAIAGNTGLHEFRRTGGNGVQVLRLQLEKYGRPRFLLSFYLAPASGFDVLYRDGGTVLQGTLRSRSGRWSRHWFRADPPLWRRLLRRPWPAPVDLVRQCVQLLPEIEAWWQAPAASAHITVIPHRFPGHAAP